MLALILPALCASTLAAAGCQQDGPVGVGARPQAEIVQQRDTSVVPIADTYVRQGSPNQNQGAELILRLQSSGKNRALLRWDQQALTQAVGGGALTGARLELTIADLADNWSAAGRTVDLHRLTHSWTELGATWNCAVDSVPGNSRADCTGATAWDMDHSASYPWVATPTATALLRNGQTGVVTFDVTADVQAWLTGQQQNFGWILKKTVEGDPGKVEFGSRESGAAPRLVLVIGAPETTWPLLTDSYPVLDTTRVVSHPIDTALVYFRTDIVLRFKVGISDSAKAAFLARNSLQVLGVTRSGQFFVRIPDPGSTLQSLYDALDRIEADAAILLVAPIPRQPWPQSDFVRLPTDGTGQTRSDWSSNTVGTWAMRAIRAPLAWGCETGEYGGAPVRVGMFEWKHEPSHPEFAPSSPHLWEPRDAALHDYAPVPAETVVARRAHATSTAGLLSAEGDNGSGIAGANWRTNLFMYAGYSPQNRPLDLVTGFYLLSQAISADRLRVLSLSADVEFPDSVLPKDRERMIDGVMAEMRFSLFSDSSKLLVVVAAGNEQFSGDVGGYPAAHRAALVRAALLRLAQDAGYRDRIVVVAGTTVGNQFWSAGNFFAGSATDIAAPAASVAVLGPWNGETGPGVPLTVRTGTSLAAPLVAGVAAQLLAMDSTLTAAQVKDYILRGASEQRLSTTTGQMVTPPAVQGAPETIYQLDAYGALALLSRERPGTPICGYPVRLASERRIALDRPGSPVVLSVPGAHVVTGLSVAQGGRLISVFDDDDETGSLGSILIDHRGARLGAVPDVRRMFLEKDTVDRLDYMVAGRTQEWPVFIRRGASDDTLDFVSAVVAAEDLPYTSGRVWVSPTANAAIVSVTVYVNDQCFEGNPMTQRWLLVPAAGGSAVQIGERRYCGPYQEGDPLYNPAYDAAWSHDGRRAALVSYYWEGPSDWGGTITTVLRSGGVREDEVPGVFFYYPMYLSDDSLLRVEQWNGSGGCDVVLRSASNPGTVVSSAPGSYADCWGAVLVIPNAPPSRTLVAAGGNRAGGAGPSRSGGFALTEPAQILNRRATAAAWRRYSPRRVQVN